MKRILSLLLTLMLLCGAALAETVYSPELTAQAAFADIYATTPAEIDTLHSEAEDGILQCPDGREYWLLRSGDANYFFTLLIDKATGELFCISLFSGGLG